MITTVTQPVAAQLENLSLRAETLVFRFTRGTHTGPFHGPGLAGFVKSLIGDELPAGCWIAPVDGGIPWFDLRAEYRFTLYAVDGAQSVLDTVRNAARNACRSEEATVDARAFGPRWQYVRSLDALHPDEPEIRSTSDLTELGPTAIAAEAEIWSSAGTVWMRFLTPLQLLRPKSRRKRKGMARFCQDAAELDGSLLLERLRQSIVALARRLGLQDSLPIPDVQLELSPKDLFWHGSTQVDASGREKPVYGLSGVVGLYLDGPSAARVWHWLVLGQHLGIGQRRSFGYGRYRLEGPSGECVGIRPRRAASLLRPAFNLGNLDAAWDAIRKNKRRAAFDRELDRITFGLPPEADHRTELNAMARRVVANEYEIPALQGILIDKPKGGQRALAVPPLLDRVLQRAVAQMLTRIIEPVMYAHSFGYRPGRNRVQARDLIQHLVRKGYTWFFESDIDNFFDAVDHALIYNRLMSLLPDDPAVDRIMRWITAPVRYQGRLIQRGGLPQGSPLSPLLANLVLDDFDNDLLSAGFRPVRFADDFIVPCRSRDEAERAGAVVTRSLAEKGLTVNGDETRIARFSDGLKFLGYRFVNDLVVESGRSRGAQRKPEEDPHPASWVSELGRDDERSDRDASPTTVQNNAVSKLSSPPLVTSAGEARTGGTLVIVSEPGCVLYTREGQLWRQAPESEAASVAPWSEVGGLLLLGYQRITQAVLMRAMQHQVPVFFTDSFGRLRGRAVSDAAHDSIDLWPDQLDASSSDVQALAIAASLVEARLAHQAQVLRRRGISRPELAVFDRALARVASKNSLESLRGIEGSATRAYFVFVAKLIPEWCGFAGRNRRPPRDPFNALLSLGYTMLYAQTETLIRLSGLHPGYGFYHQRRGCHAALASDLMESFRHLVESTAMAQLNRRQLSAESFTLDDQKGCRLAPEARRSFLAALARRLSGRMTATDGISLTGHEHMYRQVESVRAWVRNRNDHFNAIRLK